MNIIAVDDDLSALEALERSIRAAAPEATLAVFDSCQRALAYAQHTRVDAAFLDINMSEMNGQILAKRLMALNSRVNIIFVTGYIQYAVNAYRMHASGYIHKPIDPQRVREELDNLRNPPAGQTPRRVGPYAFEHAAQRVLFRGQDALLTPREYAIFHFLACHPNTFFTPQQLFEHTFGLDAIDAVDALYPHISRLRKKLDLDGAGRLAGVWIEQARGKGYRLVRSAKA